jgi:hypothetical protein
MPFNPNTAGLQYGIQWVINNREETGLPLRDPLELGDGWSRVFINPDNDTVLNGFNLILLPYTEETAPATTDPETGIVTPEEISYSAANITSISSLTITCTTAGGDLFTEDDRLFTTPSLAYGACKVGILDGSYYQWDKVFDRSYVEYMPGLSVATPFINGKDVVTEELGLLPQEPSDLEADPPVYPMDTFTKIRPDTRPKVILRYSSTFVGTIDGQPYSETVTWYHVVWQKAYDWGRYVGEALGDKTYFFNDYTSDLR